VVGAATFAVLVCLAPKANAMVDRPFLYSVEALVGYADIVVLGRVVEPVDLSDPHIAVLEVLKGQFPASEPLTVTSNPRYTGAWPQNADAIFCLRRAAEGTSGQPQYELVDSSSPPYFHGSVNSERVVTMTGRSPASFENLLAAVRAAAKYSTKPGHLTHLDPSRVPDYPASEVFRLTSLRLAVPVDERLERLARAWAVSRYPESRRYATEVLWRFPNPTTVALLRSMNRDQDREIVPATYWDPRPDWRVLSVFPVRMEALRTLTRMNVPVGDAKLVEPVPTYADLRWGPWDLGFTCVLLAASTGRRWRRHEPWHWFAHVCVFSLLALALSAAHFAWRSYAVCDCASLSFGGTGFEVCSSAGGVHVLAVADLSPPRAIVVKATDTPALWFTPLLTPAHMDARLGFSTETGQIAGENKPYAYRLTRIPFGTIIAPLAALPVIVGLGRLTANLRRRTRRRAGRCPACGYDLQGAPGLRCPECGAPVARVPAPPTPV
jgi:hypothetical protein